MTYNRKTINKNSLRECLLILEREIIEHPTFTHEQQTAALLVTMETARVLLDGMETPTRGWL